MIHARFGLSPPAVLSGLVGIASFFTSVAIAIYTFLGVFGLVAAKKKTYKFLRRFSVLWWTFTVISSVLVLVDIIALAEAETEPVIAGILFGAYVAMMTYFGMAIRQYAQVLKARPAVDGPEHSIQIQLTDIEEVK
jgi:NO-binding membrane sensor protein with MHYT domain